MRNDAVRKDEVGRFLADEELLEDDLIARRQIAARPSAPES